MAIDLGTLISKANDYKQILSNTQNYRKEWPKKMKPLILKTLKEILKQTEIKGELEIQDNIENLEAIVLNLGRSASGISENLENTDIKRAMIKSNGALIYQQLFNGKVMIMTVSPYIEGYGEPKPPKPLEILRPEELTHSFIIRHVETFLKDITEWEDYDDDEPSSKHAFNPIGFNREIITED
ncbi:MAG: hypothetical protein P1U56_02365 [Saprospiraceae bacterium]|nr:hypothetical protein [Saprospiraceae bacterium]